MVYDRQPVLGIAGQAVGVVVYLDCEIATAAPNASVMIRLLHGVETTEGNDTLHVNRADVISQVH